MPFERMKSLLQSSAHKVLDKAEFKMNPEMRGINALAGAFALLVMADHVAEEAEKDAVSEFLIDLDVIIEKGLIREISELFLQHITRLEKAKKISTLEFNVTVGEILKDVSAVKDDEEYCKMVADTVSLVTSGSAVDPNEIKTRERILKVLKV